MGVGCFPILKPNCDELKWESDGKALVSSAYYGILAGAADENNLRPLSDFFYDSGIYSEQDEEAEEKEPLYFPIKDGIETVENLILAVKKGISETTKQKFSDEEKNEILECLEELKGFLENARQHSSEFLLCLW